MPYIYDHDELYDFDLSYDGWPLYDTGLPSGITRTGQRLFDLLPDYVRDADAKDDTVPATLQPGCATTSRARRAPT